MSIIFYSFQWSNVYFLHRETYGQLSCGLTYIVIDFGWRLDICWLVFEYQSWDYSCDFVLSVQLEKDINWWLLEYSGNRVTRCTHAKRYAQRTKETLLRGYSNILQKIKYCLILLYMKKESCFDLLWRPWPWWFSTGQ